MTTNTTNDFTKVKYKVWDLVGEGKFDEARSTVTSSSIEGMERTKLLNYIYRNKRTRLAVSEMKESDKVNELLSKQLRDQRVISDTRTARSQQEPILGRSEAVRESHPYDEECDCPDCKHGRIEVEDSNDPKFDQGDRYGDPDPDHKQSGPPSTISSTDQADQQRPMEHKVPRFFYKSAEVQVELTDPRTQELSWVDPVEFSRGIDVDDLSEEQKVELYKDAREAYKKVFNKLLEVTGGATGSAPELNAASMSLENLLMRLQRSMSTTQAQIKEEEKQTEALEEHIEESFQASPPPIDAVDIEKQEEETVIVVEVDPDDTNWFKTARERRKAARDSKSNEKSDKMFRV